MKFSISTAKLNTILSRVSKGLGGPLMPVTEYFEVMLQDGALYITATNRVNWITDTVDDMEGEAGTVLVKADKLIKLVGRTTKDTMTFTLKDDYLEVKGNGAYKIPLLANEEFPQWEFEGDPEPVTVPAATMKQMFATNKAALGQNFGYYLADKAITLDGIKLCANYSVKFFEDGRAMYVSQQLVDLLMTLTGEAVKIEMDGNKLLFTTPTTQIFGTAMDGIKDYPITNVNALLESEYANRVTIKRTELLEILKRLELFVNKDKNSAIKMVFNKEAIELSDADGNSTEALESQSDTLENEGHAVFVNVQLLNSLIHAMNSVTIDLWFDPEQSSLKITDTLVTNILGTVVM